VSQRAARSVQDRLLHSCWEIAELALCCGTAVMQDSTSNAFGAWAAARIHTMHVIAASLIRTMQTIAAVNGGAIPVILFTSLPTEDKQSHKQQLQGISTATVSPSCMTTLTRALLLTPCMTASPQLVLEAFQLLFSPAVLTPCMHAAHDCIRNARNTTSNMHAIAAEEQGGGEGQIVVTQSTASPVLHAAYAAAWTGTAAAPPPIPACGSASSVSGAGLAAAETTEEAGRIHEPATLEIPVTWMEEAAGVGIGDHHPHMLLLWWVFISTWFFLLFLSTLFFYPCTKN
jgi:hypothetical protein